VGTRSPREITDQMGDNWYSWKRTYRRKTMNN